jgi:AraC-like DNA-binding protein
VWKYKPVGLFLGAFYDQNDHIGFKGKLDEIRIWNYARTPEQINQYLNTPLSGKEPGLVAYYNFDDKDSKKVTDLSPSKNHALPRDNGTLTYVNSSAMIEPVITGYTVRDNNSVLVRWACEHDHIKPKQYILDLASDPDFQVLLPNYKNRKLTGTNAIELINLETRSKYYVRVKGVFNDNEITAFSKTVEINDFGYSLNADLSYYTDSLITIPLFDRSGSNSETVPINKDSKSFRIDFSISNINPDLKFKFRYKLEDIDTNWYYPEEGDYTVNYSNVSPGTYHLMLEVSDGKGLFRGNKHLIVLKVEQSPLRIVCVLLLLAAACLFVLFFRRKYQVKIIDKGRLVKVDEETDKLKEIRNHIETHKPYLDKNLTIQSLAEMLNLSKADLSAILNNQLNKNFNDFINSYRVEEVKRKLDDPEFNKYTVLTIAEMCGFNSQSSFYRIFKNLTGKTPNDYQNKGKG